MTEHEQRIEAAAKAAFERMMTDNPINSGGVPEMVWDNEPEALRRNWRVAIEDGIRAWQKAATRHSEGRLRQPSLPGGRRVSIESQMDSEQDQLDRERQRGLVMANMAYCRFQNTVADLADCQEVMSDMSDTSGLSKDERRAAWRLVRICREIVADVDANWTEEEMVV